MGRSLVLFSLLITSGLAVTSCVRVFPEVVAGRPWRLEVWPNEPPVVAAPLPLCAVTLAGLLCTVLVGACLLTVNTQKSRAERIAKEMTKDIRLLAMVAERTTNGVILTDRVRRIIWANEGFTRLSGYTLDEVIGKVPGRVLQCPDTDMETVQAMRDALNAEQGFVGQIVNRHKQGHLFWVHIDIQPLHDEWGTFIGFLSIESDITDQKQVSEALREANERTALALAGGGLAIWEWNPMVDYLQLDERWDFIVGGCKLPHRNSYSVAYWIDRIHPEDVAKFQTAIAACLQGQEGSLECEHRFNTANNEYAWLQVNGRVAERDADGIPTKVAGTMLDITKRKELERQLAQSQKLEAIGQLAAGVAHEINTPMQCVFSNVEYLQSSIAKVFELADSYRSLPFSCELSENLVSQIDAIEQLCRFESVRAGAEDAIREAADGSQRVIEIVRAMKTMSHPGTANKTPTDLNRLLTDAIIIARNHWNHVANLRVDLDPDIGEFPALPAPLSQVILNLLINAADAIAEKLGSDPVERGEIIVRSYSTGDGVGIEVQDSGCGIPENIKDRIFDPFYTTKEVGKGTGQGLAIAYDVVVNRHQGRIDACASPGGGTLFCVWLPKYRVAAGRVVELPADRNN